MPAAMPGSFDAEGFLRTLTHRPGVYRMLDAAGKVLYVGKAKDLQRRVSSYFGSRPHDAKTTLLLRSVAGMDVTVTGTEQEALLLEYNLIKEHKPRFNVVLRDDKSYPYIHVSTDQEFPRFEFHRGSRRGGGRYFGPFPSAGAVRETLQQIQKLFRVRQCSDSFFANRSRPCLQYQIQRCTAPCVGLIDAEDYRRDVDDAIQFIEGRGTAVLAGLVTRMEACAARLDYERAARYRDQISAIRHVQQQQSIDGGGETDLDALGLAEEHGQYCVAVLMIRGGRVLGARTLFPRTAPGTPPLEVLSAFVLQHYLGQSPPPEILLSAEVEDADALGEVLGERAGHPVALRQRVRGKRRRWIEMALGNARQAARSRAAAAATLAEQYEQLAEALSLPAVPQRLECFDISHTQGGETVASCVVFTASGPARADYRRYNIRGEVTAGDDYAALAEAVGRRFGRGKATAPTVPDLLLIDGGRAQLSRVSDVLEELGLNSLPVFSIAKGEGRRASADRIFRPREEAPLRLATDTPAMHLLQYLRDEAHRFALGGHRQRRARRQAGSALEAIPGLGPRRRRALLQHFGGLQGITRAGIDDLAATPGISRPLAERIYGHFHGDAAD
ncbi:MAG: excinuclease ABC subunit UvrC [Gammaproteobacteria bacterium]|nr:excinuclease ABC subunit UvrC [Gammaproteobacteria bacterium]